LADPEIRGALTRLGLPGARTEDGTSREEVVALFGEPDSGSVGFDGFSGGMSAWKDGTGAINTIQFVNDKAETVRDVLRLRGISLEFPSVSTASYRPFPFPGPSPPDSKLGSYAIIESVGGGLRKTVGIPPR
jgi:hypothetical protein